MGKKEVLKAILLSWLLTLAPLAQSDQSLQSDLNLSDYKGKVVILDFWASWCVPCRRSFPWMNAMHDKYNDAGLVILAVNLDRDRESADHFLSKYTADFEIVYDPQAALASQFGVEVMPSSFVIGRDGEIVVKHTGFKVKRQADYESTIQTAIGERTAE